MKYKILPQNNNFYKGSSDTHKLLSYSCYLSIWSDITEQINEIATVFFFSVDTFFYRLCVLGTCNQFLSVITGAPLTTPKSSA